MTTPPRMLAGFNGGGPPPSWQSLRHAAVSIVAARDPADKVALSAEAERRWQAGALPVGDGGGRVLPARPGRPDEPRLLPPRAVPKRGFETPNGRVSLLHAVAHIELNAIDMAWDLIGRFATPALPRAFCDDWVRVAAEEARHFAMLANRLSELGSHYGALAAHDGLWQAAAATTEDIAARLAIVPLVLEARGLDVTPHMIERLAAAGDRRSADLLDIIYRDEETHVAAGHRWFAHICAERRLDPLDTFHALVRNHFRGQIKPPFNRESRRRAGLEPPYYEPLAPPATTPRGT